jgi:Flp pilus assembly protein TadG
MTRPRRTERGAAAAELAILAPVVIMLVALMVGGARVWFARAAVIDAAYATARAATLERNAAAARSSAQSLAVAALGDVPCAGHTVTIDTSGFAAPVGTPAQVRARITCTVDLADLFGLSVPGSLTVEGFATSALDTYRSRK